MQLDSTSRYTTVNTHKMASEPLPSSTAVASLLALQDVFVHDRVALPQTSSCSTCSAQYRRPRDKKMCSVKRDCPEPSPLRAPVTLSPLLTSADSYARNYYSCTTGKVNAVPLRPVNGTLPGSVYHGRLRRESKHILALAKWRAQVQDSTEPSKCRRRSNSTEGDQANSSEVLPGSNAWQAWHYGVARRTPQPQTSVMAFGGQPESFDASRRPGTFSVQAGTSVPCPRTHTVHLSNNHPSNNDVDTAPSSHQAASVTTPFRTVDNQHGAQNRPETFVQPHMTPFQGDQLQQNTQRIVAGQTQPYQTYYQGFQSNMNVPREGNQHSNMCMVPLASTPVLYHHQQHPGPILPMHQSQNQLQSTTPFQQQNHSLNVPESKIINTELSTKPKNNSGHVEIAVDTRSTTQTTLPKNYPAKSKKAVRTKIASKHKILKGVKKTNGSSSRRRKATPWTTEEDKRLIDMVAQHGPQNWRVIASGVGSRTPAQVAQRWRKTLNPELVKVNKGKWTKEEDSLLRELIKKHSDSNWQIISDGFNGTRTVKHCRERWLKHISPNLKHNEPWTAKEDNMILRLHRELGYNGWAEIARSLPGRTDNAVKRRYRSLTRLRNSP